MSNKTQEPPALMSIESQEHKLIAMTLAAVENDLKNGTASSQIKTHFLQLATKKAQIELEQLKLRNLLLEEKIKTEQATREIEELVEKALNALKGYRFDPNDPDSEDDDYYD